VLGLDPGYRTGCKVALVDATGNVLASGVIQVTKSDGERRAAATSLLRLIKTHHVTLISIGNGTASYETEQFVAALIRDNDLKDVHYLITNEAGASVYSASQLAKEELPDYDVTIRGAVSIARRVQDPLAELVKIDPQAIGVGQYQHDVSQKDLKETLDATVEDAVNHVGGDLNTASPALLNRIAGINSAIAKNIVAYRNKNGRFTSRNRAKNGAINHERQILQLQRNPAITDLCQQPDRSASPWHLFSAGGYRQHENCLPDEHWPDFCDGIFQPVHQHDPQQHPKQYPHHCADGGCGFGSYRS